MMLALGQLIQQVVKNDNVRYLGSLNYVPIGITPAKKDETLSLCPTHSYNRAPKKRNIIVLEMNSVRKRHTLLMLLDPMTILIIIVHRCM